MNWVDYLLGGLLILFALLIIAAVLMQEGRKKGLSGTISGGAETFLSKGKAKALDSWLLRWTKYLAIIFFVLVLAANVVNLIWG